MTDQSIKLALSILRPIRSLARRERRTIKGQIELMLLAQMRIKK